MHTAGRIADEQAGSIANGGKLHISLATLRNPFLQYADKADRGTPLLRSTIHRVFGGR